MVSCHGNRWRFLCCLPAVDRALPVRCNINRYNDINPCNVLRSFPNVVYLLWENR